MESHFLVVLKETKKSHFLIYKLQRCPYHDQVIVAKGNASSDIQCVTISSVGKPKQPGKARVHASHIKLLSIYITSIELGRVPDV